MAHLVLDTSLAVDLATSISACNKSTNGHVDLRIVDGIFIYHNTKVI